MAIFAKQILKFVWWSLILIGLSACKPFGKSFFQKEHLDRNLPAEASPIEEKLVFKISQVSNYVFPSSYVNQNSTLSVDFNNITAGSPGDDVDVSYTCYFDRTVDNQVSTANRCSNLIGTESFHPYSGVLTWTPDQTVAGPFEFKVIATKNTETASQIFVVHVRELYSLSNIKANFDAYFASGIAGASIGLDYWKDVGSSGHKAILSGSALNWKGAYRYDDQLRYRFDGQSYFYTPTGILENSQEIGIHLWYYPENASQLNKVILDSESNTHSQKITFRHSNFELGAIELEVGDGNLYVKKVLQDNPVCYWRLSDTGSTVKDVIGNCTAGSFTGTVTKGSSGAFSNDNNTSVNFAGTGEISVPYTSLLDFGTGNFTVEAWLKSTYTGDYQTILSKDPPPVAGTGLILYTFIGTGVMRTWVGGTATNWTGVVTDGSWHHVVLVRNSGNLYLYRDGVVQGPVAAAGNTNVAFSSVHIGRLPIVQYPFFGNIDDIAFYNYALSSSQVQAHYAAATNTNAAICTTTSTFFDQAWNYLSLLLKNNTFQFLVNGSQKCSLSHAIASNFATNSFTFGADSDGNNGVTGSISDVKVYSSSTNVGSSSDVKSNFGALANRYRSYPILDSLNSSVVLYLDPANYKGGLSFGGIGCAISEFFDLSPNSFLATLTNFASCGTTSGFNGSGSSSDPYRLTFDGVNDNVVITNPTSFYSNQEFSISVWYRGTDVGTNILKGKGLLAWNNNFYYAGLVLNGGYARYAHYDQADSGWSSAVPIQSSSLVADGNWKHILYVNYSDEKGDLYINGVKEINRVNSRIFDSGTSYPFNPVHIMANDNGVYTSGEIGHVSLYSKAFSQSEVTMHCQIFMSRFGGSRCN